MILMTGMNDSIGHFIQHSHFIDELGRVPFKSDTTGFFSGSPQINIQSVSHDPGMSILGVALLVLMLFISAVWYFTPDLIRGNFTALATNPLKRNWESGTNKAGIIINALLYLNFIVVIPVLIMLVLNNLIPDYLNIGLSGNTLFLLIYIIAAYILFRQIFVAATAWLFATKAMGKAHNKLLNSLEKTLGLIVLPLLFVFIYTDLSFIIGFGGLLMLLFIISRWVFTMAIGLRITKFSWFHIILYLCTLEFIPFLLVIKLLKSQVFPL
ncbi:MAG: DUF4271 domain-containing protein [Chlorobi bacterium]|nr:DUF4271 domain-containing protein [Chlorobiota bacterium]